MFSVLFHRSAVPELQPTEVKWGGVPWNIKIYQNKYEPGMALYAAISSNIFENEVPKSFDASVRKWSIEVSILLSIHSWCHTV